MSTVGPSGAQVEIRHGKQRAVIVEVGGGLRSYDVDDRAVVDGYAADVMASGGRGQVLFPWPNRLAGGRWDDAGSARQLPLSEPDRGTAIHGLVRWSRWELSRDGDSEALASHTLVPQPGYPFRMGCRIRYRLGADGLSVTTSVRNESARPAPFGLGFHPYLAAGDGLVDSLTLTVPAVTRLLSDANGIPTGRAPVAGSALDFTSSRRIGDQVIDDGFTDLARDSSGRVRVSVDRRAGPVHLWAGPGFEFLQVFTGDTLAPQAKRRGLAIEPMTCPANALASGDALIRLDPGEETEFEWGITPFD